MWKIMKYQEGIQIIKYTCLRILFFCSNYCVYPETLFFMILFYLNQHGKRMRVLCSSIFYVHVSFPCCVLIFMICLIVFSNVLSLIFPRWLSFSLLICVYVCLSPCLCLFPHNGLPFCPSLPACLSVFASKSSCLCLCVKKKMCKHAH